MGSRRIFLKQSAAMAVAAGMPWYLKGDYEERKIGVALAGLGSYSTGQLGPSLKRTHNCSLKGIITGSAEKIPEWQRNYKVRDAQVYDYSQMHQLANDDEIDVVYIVLPNSMHAEYAIKAAEAGKHVWCEKPMALNQNECERIIEACRKNGVKLSIGYRMHHEPNTQTLMKWAKTKPYGELTGVTAEAGFYFGGGDPGNWRLKKKMGGGALYDMGVYCINAARYATGQEPIGVVARELNKRKELFSEVDETTEFELYFKNDLKVSCKTSFGESINQLWVDCKNGNYFLQPMQSYSGVGGRTSDGKILQPIKGKQQVLQMQNDAKAILQNLPEMVPGEEGLKDIVIVEAIKKSAQNDSKYVHL